jgi:hypothetical protein
VVYRLKRRVAWWCGRIHNDIIVDSRVGYLPRASRCLQEHDIAQGDMRAFAWIPQHGYHCDNARCVSSCNHKRRYSAVLRRRCCGSMFAAERLLSWTLGRVGRTCRGDPPSIMSREEVHDSQTRALDVKSCHLVGVSSGLWMQRNFGGAGAKASSGYAASRSMVVVTRTPNVPQ